MKARRCLLTRARVSMLWLFWQVAVNGLHGADVSIEPPGAWIVLPLANSEVAREGSQLWGPASADPKYSALYTGDLLRTLENGRATLRLGENSLVNIDQLTLVTILEPRSASAKCRFNVKRGLLYLLHRDVPSNLEIQTVAVNAAVEGTDFAVSVDEDGTTTIALLDGRVRMSNDKGTNTLESGEKGIAVPGRRPIKTALIDAVNTVQWSLYYPAVLDPDELHLGDASPFSAALAAYRKGALLQALALSPTNAISANAEERLFRAGLLLSVGRVADCEALLKLEQTNSLVTALKYVIAAVTSRSVPGPGTNSSPSQCLGLSYYAQSEHDLSGALIAAQQAVLLSPNFAFALERVAELQFSFGRTGPAKQTLSQSLQFAPDNAQAHALLGFLLAADNRIDAAIAEFDNAITLDGNLANAWLGRGLCRIKQRNTKAGIQDLQTAAVLEPTRSLLRSYLGKAFTDARQGGKANQELALAARLDERDPTPLLYSALLRREQNRINEAVSDLERSIELNTNRAVYRSALLLDQDQAVRGANLATAYEWNGMEQVAAREAARAVTYDYANYSAHLFLANSLNALRDPTRFNLRYETPWLNEALLANILAPVNAGVLSQNINQQEYSKLFEVNRLGFITDSSYRSDGQFHQLASQFGTYDNIGYSADFDYQHNEGVRINNELTRVAGSLTTKYQITPQDSVLAQAEFQQYHSGDNFQYYNPDLGVHTNFDYQEHSIPNIAIGYHREWAPGMHSLILGGFLTAEQHFSDPNGSVYYLDPATDPTDLVFARTNHLFSAPFGYDYKNRFQIASAELSQIYQTEHQFMIIGGRFQHGTVDAQDHLTPMGAPVDSSTHTIHEGLGRIVIYGYETMELPTHLYLTVGIAWDQVTYPNNYLDFPLSQGQRTHAQLGPKAALLWNPVPEVTIRGIFAQSIGGLVFDQSFRLEPTQLDGFNQTFRNIIPTSVVDAGSAPTLQIAGGAIDLKFPTRTYLSVQAQLLKSDVTKTVGAYEVGVDIVSTNTIQRLNYREPSLVVSLNQLVGDDWSCGVQYDYMSSELAIGFPQIFEPRVLPPDLTTRAYLHRLTPFLVFNSGSRLFARAEASWYLQSNSGYTPFMPGDDFYQINLFAGYRFSYQHGDITLGILNLTGTDYRLNPLNLYAELPRERVFSVQLRLNF